MKITPIDPPRTFKVGYKQEIQLKDCGHIALGPDEQVTFTTELGGEYDVVRKSWGFYATPSMNQRLKKFGLKAALIKSPDGKYYIFLVETGKETDFQHYVQAENLHIICWLDDDANLQEIERKLDDANG